ncbi:MAG TPA: metallophosphoesterase, partial [Cyclobacteriaceae bacterium]
IEGLTKETGTTYFLVFGDWGRNGQGDQQDVADWMGIAANQLTARFVISTGDNFYCCGVASTEDYQWLSSFEQVYRSHSLQIPWYVTLGNHDYQGNVQAQLDYSKKSQRWKMPNRYFTQVLNGIRFIFLDTSPFIKDYYKDSERYSDLAKQDTTKQLKWLDSVLVHSPEKTKIAVGHHPLYSLGDHGNENDLQIMLEKRFEKYNISYFAGHDHSLQSLQPSKSSVHYIISGGGSEHTPVKIDPQITKFAKGTTGFLVAGASDAALKLYYINKQGLILYKETIPR